MTKYYWVKPKLYKACGIRGADMGRGDLIPDNISIPCECTLIRLSWVDGDYDSGGAYWGGGMGSYIFQAMGMNKAGDEVELYTRALTHADAREKFRKILPNIEFVASKERKFRY